MEKKIIDGIREYYELPDHVTDKEIERDLKGSLGEARINLHFAINDLKKAFGESMPNIFKKYFKKK